MDASAAAASGPGARSGIGFNLALIALGAALLGLAAAYGIDALRQGGETAAAGTATRALGGRQLTIPAAWLRGAAGDGAGFAKQVELALRLPLGPDGALRDVAVTLMPRSRVRPSAALLDGVYLHQFMPEQVAGPPGLVGKPLVARDGLAGETVWYDALSPNPFVAKCALPVVAEQPGRCLRAVHLGPGLAAVYSFGADVLEEWRRFDAVLAGPLRQIGAL
jgi:hypothetical protein